MTGSLEQALEEKARKRCHQINEDWRHSAEEAAIEFQKQHKATTDTFMENIDEKNSEIAMFKEEVDRCRDHVNQIDGKTMDLELTLKNSKLSEENMAQTNTQLNQRLEQMQLTMNASQNEMQQHVLRLREQHDEEKATLRDGLNQQHRKQLESLAERVQEEGKQTSEDFLRNENELRSLWNNWEATADDSTKAFEKSIDSLKKELHSETE